MHSFGRVCNFSARGVDRSEVEHCSSDASRLCSGVIKLLTCFFHVIVTDANELHAIGGRSDPAQGGLQRFVLRDTAAALQFQPMKAASTSLGRCCSKHDSPRKK